jgi:hypothetical protein
VEQRKIFASAGNRTQVAFLSTHANISAPKIAQLDNSSLSASFVLQNMNL